jgi:hypothetical protein
MRGRSAALLVVGIATAAVLAVAGGCEAIVGTDLPAYTCAVGDPTACPAGMYCANSTCMACDSQHCGGVNEAGVDATGQDGTATDSRPPVDATSDTTPPPNDAPPPDVTPPPDTGGLSPVGAACTVGTTCQSGICGDSTVLTMTVVTAIGQPICTKPCCTTGDCPGGFVCFGAGTGGNYCVPATALMRPTGGTTLPGGACPVGDSDCASGKCYSGHCLDTCCADSDCTNGTVCALESTAVDGHKAFACLPYTGFDAGAACSTSTQCLNNDCDTMICRPHCCGTNSCKANGFFACELDTTGTDDTTTCFYPGSPPTTGTAAYGAHCTSYDQCLSRACDPYTSTCTEHCCTDADCAQVGIPGYVCRPALGANRFLICTAP